MRFPSLPATERHPFRDAALPMGKRIDDLLSRLTLGERIALLHQYAPDMERLGIASFRTGHGGAARRLLAGRGDGLSAVERRGRRDAGWLDVVNAHFASGSPPRRSASTSCARRRQRDD
ncbi:hypothetical protein, partial [Streptomyces europaeiscabiei]|uniref:hypothetical protein n=1 Tax=Streptomyces europaeiscabiei TaxID=146819 RepID=UPI000A885D00